MYLAVSTRTIGLPSPNLPLTHASQPAIRQFSAIVFDENGNEIDWMSAPNPPAILAVDIDLKPLDEIAAAQTKGEYVHPAYSLAWFIKRAQACDMIVGHNVHFDLHAIRVLAARLTGIEWVPEAPIYCTMINAAPSLNLPPTAGQVALGRLEPRPPTIPECMRHFFEEDLLETPDGLSEVRACMKIFHRLQSSLVGGEVISMPRR